MLTRRPGGQSAVPGLGTESSDSPGRAPVSPRERGGHHRLGAYLDMKIHLEKNLEEERQILLQQQKICRNRARKYFLESNRRKKAFEDKRKEQEEKEHQIREKILQQRKQKFEEVTEKFQRAHIPFSQRRRAVFPKSVPPLEEALKQIQESNLKSEVNLPFSHRPTINWRAIDSSLPSTLSKNDHKNQKHLLSKISCDKEMKENSMANLAANKNVFQLKLEETQKLLEDQHLSSLQNFCDEVNRITNSETLSSIDSLEAGQHEEVYLTLNKEPSTSIQQNSVSLKLANLQSTNINCFDEDKLLVSKTQHINNWLTNLDAQKTQSVTCFSDMLSKSNVLPVWEAFNNKEQNPSTLSRTVQRVTSTANNNSVAFLYSPPIVELDKKSEETSEASTMRISDSTLAELKRERPLVTKSPTFKFSKAWTAPDFLNQEVATFSNQETYSKLAQENRGTSIPASFMPTATPLVLPSNTQSARPLAKNNIHIKEIDPVQCSDKLDELKDVKDERIKYFNYNKKELPLFSDNVQTTYLPQNSDSKDKKQKLYESSTSLSNVASNYDLLDEHKKIKYNIHERNGVRFLKSILKKESKYEHDYFKALIINQGFKFRNQKAAAIRDSIELTKEKSAEIPKITKKLRWFDETGDIENNTEDSHSLKNRTRMTQPWSQELHIKSVAGNSLTSVPACAVNSNRKKSKDDSLSENVTALGGPGTDHAPLNCFIPSSYNFTKQAWPASKKEENKITMRNGNSRTPKGNPHRSGAKVIRRTGSAKVQSSFMYTNRKGTVIQPRSASKANTFLQTQGKLIIPHPPPKPTSNIRSGKNIHVSKCQSIITENSQNIITYNCFNSKCMLPTEHNLNQWNQESSPLLSDPRSDLVTVITSLPSYYSSECQTLAKTNHSNGTQMVTQQDGTLYCTQRSPVCEESSQSVTLRTTEEESSPLWKRGNNILSQNERATDSTVRRRKQLENKRRSPLEQKRKNPGSVGQKYNEQINNFGQSAQLSSNEPKLTTRGTSNDGEDMQETICQNPSIKNTLQIIPLLNSLPRPPPSPDVGSRLQRKY
ncbi:centrosomal protein of 126 kDa isoform X3 [Marmota marmota marmota]|uniref:centrosomal protein of 126 kDa isoform X3 n=1 Tax=Marmota marmota marmota TaxID=9994 RepID=UPI002092547D|nr:centrosomal protein of 126 kDa isoform X3 [Marmota marmota marmota]